MARTKWRWEEEWQCYVPDGLKDDAVLPQAAAPIPTVRELHDPGCLCSACMTAGQRHRDYLKAKRCEW